ncbi:uncharacterized protein TRIADDRAFT_2319, partial [Trichoplax adhaerens]
KIHQLLKTGYGMDITPGQRKFGPPSDWQGPPPQDCEIYIGKIPHDALEDELIPLLQTCGKIYELRLMIDPASGHNRGYAFLSYTTKEAANQCVRRYHGYSIRKDKPLTVIHSTPNVRLFISPIPKYMNKEEIYNKFSKLSDGLTEVIVYPDPDAKDKIRGFAFLEYVDHKAATYARRKLITDTVSLSGKVINVEWAESSKEPKDHVVGNKVKEVYCGNIAEHITEDTLNTAFLQYGSIERIKKLHDYAFICFASRESALKAIEGVRGTVINGCKVDVQLAKGPVRKEK